MADRHEITQYCNNVLSVASFKDYCPNGLQVEGRAEVRKIVTGVSASLALLEAAIAADADLILVHHGYFWKGESAPIVGAKKRRMQALLQADVSLLAYHLPLDAHPIWGNNVQLAARMGWLRDGALQPELGEQSVGDVGYLEQACSPAELSVQLERVLNHRPLWIDGGGEQIRTLAWCTGAAQSYLPRAIELGVDAFITGEISEPVVHEARENGIHFFAAGHHATERFGVQALGEHLAERFDLEVVFIDDPSPV